MKYVFALVLALGGLAAQAAPQRQEAPKPEPPRDLREALQQYHPGGGGTPALRQLTPEERAELRRQLSQFRQPPSASLAVPTKRKEP